MHPEIILIWRAQLGTLAFASNKRAWNLEDDMEYRCHCGHEEDNEMHMLMDCTDNPALALELVQNWRADLKNSHLPWNVRRKIALGWIKENNAGRTGLDHNPQNLREARIEAQNGIQFYLKLFRGRQHRRRQEIVRIQGQRNPVPQEEIEA